MPLGAHHLWPWHCILSFSLSDSWQSFEERQTEDVERSSLSCCGLFSWWIVFPGSQMEIPGFCHALIQIVEVCQVASFPFACWGTMCSVVTGGEKKVIAWSDCMLRHSLFVLATPSEIYNLWICLSIRRYCDWVVPKMKCYEAGCHGSGMKRFNIIKNTHLSNQKRNIKVTTRLTGEDHISVSRCVGLYQVLEWVSPGLLPFSRVVRLSRSEAHQV